jgi:phage baseplate assembly protein W
MSVDPRTVDYGTDLAWGLQTVTLPFPDGSMRTVQVYDVDPDWKEVTGREGLGQALARRLVTTHGSLIDDPDYGEDVRDYINDDVSASDLQQLARKVEAQFVKDERVQRAAVVATYAAGLLTLVCTIWDGAGPFKLTLQIADVGITKLEVTS